MELEVGMYVRLKTGYGKETFVRKIIEIKEHEEEETEEEYKHTEEYKYRTDGFCGLWLQNIGKSIIGKPSFNIIDLIKVGDYVNGHKIKEIMKENKFLVVTEIHKNDIFDTIVFNNEIKNVVTKEQFASIKYNVK